MDTSPIIAADGLERSWADTPVFSEVSLRIFRGDYLAISGMSGAGKSTLLRVLGTLDRGYRGRLMLFGTSVEGASDRVLSRLRNSKISFVFQSHQLLPHLSVQENILLPWAYRNSKDAAPSQRALKNVVQDLGIGGKLDAFPDALSGGQQQRVAIARALLTQPQLLLCDELTGNLDRRTADHVMDVIEAYQAKTSCALVVVSHDGAVVARAARHLQMQSGRLVDAPDDAWSEAPEMTGGDA